jgi:hypothetical protein
MATPTVRWSLRLPWSSTRRLQRLVHLDAPGRVGDVVARAIGHLLDQPEHIVLSIAAQVAHGRVEQSHDRTQVCSWRVEAAIIERCTAWCANHPGIALSWLVDAAIRCHESVCAAREGGAICGLQPRRYRRLSRELVVVLDEESHAA